jgi:hypothetical protein
MDIFTRGEGEVVLRPMGRDTTLTINTKPHWETLIPEAPHVFAGAGAATDVSPPIWLYCPGGYDNQTIGMCVGKGSKNGVATVLRIPAGATFDPANPASAPPPGPNIRLSGMYCYYNARNVHGRGSMGGGDGAVVAYSLDGMLAKGVIPEELWPDTEAYQSSYSDRNPPSAADYAAGAQHLVLVAARITSAAQYYDFLARGFPIIDGVSIGSGWMNTAEDGQFSLGGRTVGGHCTLTVGYDKKQNRLYKRNSWAGWGAKTTNPEFNSADPAFGGNANGFNNIGYCALDQYESYNLNDRALSSGQTDAFVVNTVAGFAQPKITLVSNVDMFT